VAAGIVAAALTADSRWALPYLVTDTLAEYEAAAVRLASSAALYRRVAKAVRDSRVSAPLFDTAGMHAMMIHGILRLLFRHSVDARF
jgi:predicted O-linked N-acetylglucosamine transferase (SPINDLY family)